MSTAMLYSGVEQMLDPAELSQHLGRDVATVRSELAEDAGGSTDADLLAIYVDDEAEPSYMLKHVHPKTDWVALFTDDTQRRAARLWTEGVFRQMPAAVDPSVISCGEWADGYGILMPHLAAEMLESHVPLPAWMDAAITDAMAAMHASFWEDPRLGDPGLGLCTVESQVRNLSPAKAREVYGDEPAWAEWIVEGWEDALPQIIDSGLARELRALVDDPVPIARALEGQPRTLVHGDVRPANVGLRPEGSGAPCHFVDWGRSAYTNPAVDLGFYLGFTTIEWQTDVNARIAAYEARLRWHLGGSLPPDWERQREVGLLAGVLQSNLGCRAYWGVRWSIQEGYLDHVEVDRAAIRTWASRLRETLDLL